MESKSSKRVNEVKRATRATPAGATQWWWFEGGTEVCSTCHQSYAYQTGFYCLDCDSNICPLCVQISEVSEARCSGCCD